jgi:hypothetical protein
VFEASSFDRVHGVAGTSNFSTTFDVRPAVTPRRET